MLPLAVKCVRLLPDSSPCRGSGPYSFSLGPDEGVQRSGGVPVVRGSTCSCRPSAGPPERSPTDRRHSWRRVRVSAPEHAGQALQRLPTATSLPAGGSLKVPDHVFRSSSAFHRWWDTGIQLRPGDSTTSAGATDRDVLTARHVPSVRCSNRRGGWFCGFPRMAVTDGRRDHSRSVSDDARLG